MSQKEVHEAISKRDAEVSRTRGCRGEVPDGEQIGGRGKCGFVCACVCVFYQREVSESMRGVVADLKLGC